MDYAVEYGENAIKDLDTLSSPTAQRIVRTIRKKLTTAPLEYGSRLKYYEDLYKLRVGDYRVIYRVKNNTCKVFITVIGHRSKVYEIFRRRLA